MYNINIIVQNHVHFTLFGSRLQNKTHFIAYYQEKIKGCLYKKMTGTLLMSVLLTFFSAISNIAVGVTSSGIAATLLKGCRMTNLVLKMYSKY